MTLHRGIIMNRKIWMNVKCPRPIDLQCFLSLQTFSTSVDYAKHKCLYCNDVMHNNMSVKQGIRLNPHRSINLSCTSSGVMYTLPLSRFSRAIGNCSDGTHSSLRREKLSMGLNKVSFSSRVNDIHLINSEKYPETISNTIDNNLPNYLYFHPLCTPDTLKEIVSSFRVVNDYLSEDEEDTLMKEVEPHLKRLHYENDHWDDAIHGYRETERSRWGKASSVIVSRMRQYAFPENENQIAQIHILDLAKTGVIKPHVDSIRYCGNIICGLCLLSDAVMRLVQVDNKDQVIDIMLPRRSLYIMRDESRYKYTHEVLGEKESYFDTTAVCRDRRVSIMCRNYPKQDSV